MAILNRIVSITGDLTIISLTFISPLNLFSGNLLLVKNDHLGYRYEIIELLGEGSFGLVAKAYDHKKNIECAIKIIKSFDVYYNQALVEIQLLKYIRENDPEDLFHCIRINNYFVFRNHIVTLLKPFVYLD